MSFTYRMLNVYLFFFIIIKLLFFVASFSGVGKKMGLKSVSLTSNERMMKGKPASAVKGRSARDPGRVTELPAAKASLQKISAFPSKPKTSTQEAETSQSEVR